MLNDPRLCGSTPSNCEAVLQLDTKEAGGEGVGGTGLLGFLEKGYKAEKFLFFLLKLPLAYDTYGIRIGP